MAIVYFVLAANTRTSQVLGGQSFLADYALASALLPTPGSHRDPPPLLQASASSAFPYPNPYPCIAGHQTRLLETDTPLTGHAAASPWMSMRILPGILPVKMGKTSKDQRVWRRSKSSFSLSQRLQPTRYVPHLFDFVACRMTNKL